MKQQGGSAVLVRGQGGVIRWTPRERDESRKDEGQQGVHALRIAIPVPVQLTPF